MSAGRGPFIPAALLLTALLAWFAAQAWHLDDMRRELRGRLAAQADAVRQAEATRRSLDAFAAQAQGLAESGNVPVQMVIGEFRRRGITLDTMTPALPAPVRPTEPSRP